MRANFKTINLSQKIMFKKSTVIAFTENQEVILIGEKVLRVKNVSQNILTVFNKIVAGVVVRELYELMPNKEIESLLAFLQENGLTRDWYKNEFQETAVEKQVDFFSDFLDDPNAAQKKILNTSVCIIGCGGTGNIVAQHLVASGVKKFTLIDDDLVNISNFNRQFCFDLQDLKMPKVEALSKYILSKDKNISVKIHNIKIDSQDKLKEVLNSHQKPDIIICCADSPPIEIRSIVLNYSISSNTPCLFGSVGVRDGVIGPLLTEKEYMKKFLARNQEMSLKVKGSSLTTVSSSISYLNTIVGCLMSAEIVDWITKIRDPRSLNTVLQYDNESQCVMKVPNAYMS